MAQAWYGLCRRKLRHQRPGFSAGARSDYRYQGRTALLQLFKKLVVCGRAYAAVEKELLLLNLNRTAVKPMLLSTVPPEVEQKLTRREKEIYNLLLSRLNSKEIANTLCLSVSTVRTYRKRIYQKLGVNGLAGILSKFGR